MKEKISSLVLAVVLALSFAVTSFAESPQMDAPKPIELSSEEVHDLQPFLDNNEYVFSKDEFVTNIVPNEESSDRAVTALNVAIYGTYSYATGASAIVKAYQIGAEELTLYTLSGQGNLYIGNALQASEDYSNGSGSGSKSLIAECKFFCFYSSGTTMVVNTTGTVGTNKGSSTFRRSTIYTN